MVAGIRGAGFLAAFAGLLADDPGFALVEVVLVVVFGFVCAACGFVPGVTWASNAVDNRARIPRICSG